MSVDEYGEEYPFLIAKKNTCSYRPNEWLTWIRSWLEIKHPLGLKKGGKILDVGCCIGDWANGLSKLGLKVTGVDVNMSALRFGKTKYSGINLVQGTAARMPFGDNYFEAIMSQDLLEHVGSEKQLEEVFEEMERVLKPGGKMMHKITVTEDKNWIDADSTHHIKWNAEKWQKWFEGRGWRVVKKTNRAFPEWEGLKLRKKQMHGYFLLEKSET